MAQTLEELFKNKQLLSQGGKTAAEVYEVRNSKDIRISAADPFVNTVGMSLARGARKLLGVRGSETLLEEEVTGVRIIRTTSIPFIYGSDLPRLTLRTTPLLDTMKSGANGDLGGGGVLGNAIASARDFVNDKLGIPSNIIPTKVVGDDRISSKGETQNRMIDLADIKKSGEGSLLGKFLKEGGGGNLKTIGKQAIGGAINLAKDKIRGKLFGDRSTTGFNTAGLNTDGSNITFNYGSLDNSVGITITTDSATGNRDVKGLMYSKTFTFNTPEESNGITFIRNVSELEGGLAVKTPDVVRRRFTLPGLSGFPPQEIDIPTYSELFNNVKRNTSEDSIDKDGSIKNESIVFTTIEEAKTEGEENSILLGENGVSKFSDKIELTIDRTKISSNPDRIPKSIISRRKLDSKSDGVNAIGVYSGTGTDANDDLDFVPLKFYSIYQGKTAQFRATISGLSETFSPSWEGNKFVGNPFSYYTYSGIERGISFNFKAFSLNAEEHKVMWDKLNFLTGLVYPQGYYDNSAVAPPFIRFTLGDLYDKKYTFIDSLSYTYEDTTPWQVENSERTFNGEADISMKGYRLPMMVNVSVGLKFLESRGNTSGKKFYTFTPQTS